MCNPDEETEKAWKKEDAVEKPAIVYVGILDRVIEENPSKIDFGERER